MAHLLVAALSALVLLVGANAQISAGVNAGITGVKVTIGGSGSSASADSSAANAVADNSSFSYVSARQSYPAEDENTVNTIINSGFARFYEYIALMAYFKQDNKDLHGFAKFFERLAMEKKECAFKFIKYQSRRGGVVTFGAIPAPTQYSGNGLDAFQLALSEEKQGYDALVSAYSVAVKNSDPELAFEIEKDVHFSSKKIKEMAGIVRDLQRADAKSNKWGGDNSFGEYHVDHDLEKKEKEHERHKMDKHCKKHHGKHGKHGMKHY